MAEEKKSFTRAIKCSHCGNSAPMEIVAQFSVPVGYEDAEWGWQEPDYGDMHELIHCPACQRILLCHYDWDAQEYRQPAERTVLYPPPRQGPRGLPTHIQAAHDAALRVRSIDANAYGVLLGRLLEMVCIDRNATGKTLQQQLASLAAKNEIPERLVGVANSLRSLRNIGAHASAGALSER